MDERKDIAVPPAELVALKEADRWVNESLRDLGQAFMKHEASRRTYERDKAALDLAQKGVQQASRQRDKVLGAIAESLQLPDGVWTFDAACGTLVLRGNDD